MFVEDKPASLAKPPKKPEGAEWAAPVKVIDKYPSAAGDITDCLSGDVNKDFSHLWDAISEFAPIPDELPYGRPMMPEPADQAA